jgi:hypothetical protein
VINFRRDYRMKRLSKLLAFLLVTLLAFQGVSYTGASAKSSAAAPKLKKVDLSQYDSTGFAFGGVIPVCKDGRWGAINYSGKQIVPFEYYYFQSANNAGYFILYDDDWNISLFNKKGKKITTLSGEEMQNLVASSDGYVVAGDSSNGESYQTTYKFYNYKGKLLKTVDSGYGMGVGIGDIYQSPHGFYDGKSIVTGNIKDYVYKKESDNTLSKIRPFDFGLVNKKGKVTWIDGDGIDEDSKDYLSYEEVKEDASLSGLKTGIVTYEEVALSAPVEGYFLSECFHPEYFGYYLRDSKGKLLCSVFPEKMTFEGGELQYEMLKNDTMGRECNTFAGTGEYFNSKIVRYFYDGQYLCNYGNSIVVSDGEQYALVKLAEDGLSYSIFDYISLSTNKYWLVYSDGKTGYCDHDGKIVKLFDDASEFVKGYALVIEKGKAYLINENFEKVKKLGKATGVFAGGEILEVVNGEKVTDYVIKESKSK